ncbi:hypothetical protein NKW43_15405 [Gluconobacter albidus]|uniref:hypothetical protein n=1 Tax=Gluconobacter albidus TaxID=318683 RepID=UPI0020A1A202|nr:hypothetical protein [Gluconobacter albidus]MCP1275043.1 hypothetical protein [Gluconobacter albidus]
MSETEDYKNTPEYQAYREKKDKELFWYGVGAASFPLIATVILTNISYETAEILGGPIGLAGMLITWWTFDNLKKETAVALLCETMFCLGVLWCHRY